MNTGSKQDKPTDGKDLNKSVTGIKKTPPGTVKAYTTKPTITTKIFGVSLLKAGRLRSIKYCEKDGCVCIFFIPQNLGSRYGKFQSLEEVPSEENLERNNLAKEFRKAVNTYGVDFSDILLGMERKKQLDKPDQDDSAVERAKIKKFDYAKPKIKAKDDSELSSKKPKLSIEELSRKLENLDTNKIKENDISKIISLFKSYFSKIKSKLNKNNPMLKEINLVLEEINNSQK